MEQTAVVTEPGGHEYADALSAIVRGRAEGLRAQGRPYPYTLAIGEACAVLATVSGSLVRYAEAEREREKREREKEVPDA